MQPKNIIGIDVGGANIKITDLNQHAQSISFPLWKQKHQLQETVKNLIASYRVSGSKPTRIALTMTGELADCFSSKPEGVEYITEAVVQAAREIPVSVWQTSGEFVSPEIAIEFPQLTAASNWHALATWAARSLGNEELGLLIDIGSTTADIIALKDSLPACYGLTDFERLISGELVYTGSKRTPLCAIGRSVFLDRREIPLAAEFFATTHDLYIITGDLRQEPENCDTADGRPADIANASQRIARMVCCDASELGSKQVQNIAAQLARQQLQTLKTATMKVLERLPDVPTQIICSGSSEFLVKQLVASIPSLAKAARISLTDSLSSETASAACAHAIACLANERC